MLLSHELTGPDGAPVIVLVHGIIECRETWRPVIDVLCRDHRLLAVDLRGHGASDHLPPYDLRHYAADVAETIDSLGLGAPLIIGHSLGGAVVTAVPALCPDVVGVVNVDQPLQLDGFRAGLQQLEPMLRGSRVQFEGAIDAVLESMSGPLAGEELARLTALRRPDQEVVLGTWSLILDAPAAELDVAVDELCAAVRDRPYLSLHGIDAGPAYTAWLHDRIPQATVEVWPDHGHYPFLVDLPRFLDLLDEFERSVRG